MPTVAISTDFLDAFARIPRAQQRKVREFTEKFRIDPTQRSINYEPIMQARDNRIRTVRIGEDYRAVVVHPASGDVYLLVWVDHHDEAIAWTRNRRFEINAATGALQVIQSTVVNSQDALLDDLQYNHPVAAISEFRQTMFTPYRDDELLYLGVPEEMLPSVRKINTDDDLEDLQPDLPVEAYERLFMLAAGFTMEEVLSEMDNSMTVQVDPEDFHQALQHPDSKRRFAIITSSQELEEILNEPLAKWRIFMHPSQEKLARSDYNGPVRVTGGAGTGKTVVAMHRACFLARERFNDPEDRILFTTFTRNLARSIDENLKTLCTSEEKERIEVVNLHAWAFNFLRSQGSRFELITNTDALWQEAVRSIENEFDFGFCREEFEQIIRGQDICTLEEYLRVPRLGRGTRLSRPQRETLWDIFEAYQELLARINKLDWLGMINQCRTIIQTDRLALPYRAVVVDEAQDLHPEEFRLIRSLVPNGSNDLFIVGDSHQRIYNRKVVLSKCGIQIRGSRSKTLKINYRTTEEIKRWSTSLLAGYSFDDMDGAMDSDLGYMSLMHGAAPIVKIFPDAKSESEYISEYISEELAAGMPANHICLVARTRRLLEDIYKPALYDNGIPFVLLDGRDLDEGEGIRLATMHRVKGLEFDQMIIAGVNQGIMPLEEVLNRSCDNVARREAEIRERSLFYVAATRARSNLLISCHGQPSRFIGEIAEN